MDDPLGPGFFIFLAVLLVFGFLGQDIAECVQKRRQRRREERVARNIEVAVAARAVGVAAVALTIHDVSLPRQQQNGPTAGDESMAAADRPECVFCLGELEEGEEWVVLTTCHHEFHWKCMAKWLEQKKSSCPTCRSVLRPGVSRKIPALADMV